MGILFYVLFVMLIAVYAGLAGFLLERALRTGLLAYYLFSLTMLIKTGSMLVVLIGEMEWGGIENKYYVMVFYVLTTLSIGLFWWGIDWLRSMSLSLWQFLVVILTLLLLFIENANSVSQNLFSSEELRGVLTGMLLLTVFGRIVITDLWFLMKEKGLRVALEIVTSYRVYQGLALYFVFLIFVRPFARIISYEVFSSQRNTYALFPWIAMAMYWIVPIGFILLSVARDPTGLLDPRLVSDIFVSSESGKLRFTLAKSELAPDQLQNNLLTAIGLAVQELYVGSYYALTTANVQLVVLFIGEFLVTFATNHKLKSPWNFIKAVRAVENRFVKKRIEGFKDVDSLVEFLEYLFPAIIFGRYRPTN